MKTFTKIIKCHGQIPVANMKHLFKCCDWVKSAKVLPNGNLEVVCKTKSYGSDCTECFDNMVQVLNKMTQKADISAESYIEVL